MVGFFAAALVLVAFVMRDMVPLRVAALCSNLAFIAYGFALNLPPVLLLHTLLLPVNVQADTGAARAVQAQKVQRELRAGRQV